MKDFQVGGKIIGKFTQPYVIAEIGVNHEGDLNKAKLLIELAKEGGADAAKFQTYKAETLASKNSPSYWNLKCEPTTSQFNLFKKFDSFNHEDYINLAEHCKRTEIDFLSTAFDDVAVDFLDPLMSCYKIASADLTNKPLIRKVCSKNKPVLLSTGASTISEIDSTVQLIHENGVSQIYLLHCILNYPTPNSSANLGMITALKKKYSDCVIGYSDHTLPCPEMKVLLFSYILGARVIEKHFTNDKSLPGNDHYHAMDKEDLKVFRKKVTEYLEIYGVEDKTPIEDEMISRINARRSIVAKCDILQGEQITENMITYKRPGTGIGVEFWDEVIGKKANKNITEDDLIQWKDLDD